MKYINEYLAAATLRFFKMPIFIVAITCGVYGFYFLSGEDFNRVQEEYNILIENPMNIMPYVHIAVALIVIIELLDGFFKSKYISDIICNISATVICIPVATWYLSSNPSVEDILIRAVLFYLFGLMFGRTVDALYEMGLLKTAKLVAWHVLKADISEEGDLVIKRKKRLFIDEDIIPSKIITSLEIDSLDEMNIVSREEDGEKKGNLE